MPFLPISEQSDKLADTPLCNSPAELFDLTAPFLTFLSKILAHCSLVRINKFLPKIFALDRN